MFGYYGLTGDDIVCNRTGGGATTSHADNNELSSFYYRGSLHHYNRNRRNKSEKRRASGGATCTTFNYNSSTTNLDASGVTDLHYYGGSTTKGGSSSASHRSSGASLLCRCGSGGALLPQTPSSPPPSSNTQLTHSRGAHSLPSTPNPNRRPTSPNVPRQSFGGGSDRQYEFERQKSLILSSHSRDNSEPCYSLYGTHNASSNLGSDIGGPGAMSESAVLAAVSDGSNDGGASRQLGFRGFNHWTHQTRALRYRTTSQPLMKLSTLIIVLLAFLIIGFIVLSPLFHYLM